MIEVTFSSVRLRKAEEPDDQGQRIDLQLNASANFSDICKQCSTNFFQHQRGLQRPEVLCLALPILGRILLKTMLVHILNALQFAKGICQVM